MSILAAKLMAPHRSLGRHVLPLGYCITQDFYSEDLGTKKNHIPGPPSFSYNIESGREHSFVFFF